MLNEVILQGRLTADVEIKQTQSGKSVSSFSIAVERSTKGSDGKRQTDFIDIVAWEKTAELISKYFHKGDMILINGELQVRLWEDNNKNKRKSTEVIARGVNFCGSKKDTSTEQSTSQTEPIPAQMPQGKFEEIGENDDLPF